MYHIATIGTNFIVNAFLKAVSAAEGIQCTAMYTRKREHAQPLAEKFHIPTIYTDLDEMLKDPAIDIVYIASPNSLHYVYAKQILNAGKHVICEKPFTSNMRQCEELFALANKQQRFLFEAIRTVHSANFLKIRSLLPKLGEIKLVQSNFSQYSSRYDAYLKGENPNIFNPAFSGGALADIGIYSLHFIVALFGIPQEVQYYPNLGENGIDTSGCGILKYPDFLASFSCAKDSQSEPITQIQGTLGTISVHSQPSICGQFHYHDRLAKTCEDLSDTALESALRDSLYEEVRDFVRILRENDTAEYERLALETCQVMEVFERLRKSAGIRFGDDDAAADSSQ